MHIALFIKIMVETEKSWSTFQSETKFDSINIYEYFFEILQTFKSNQKYIWFIIRFYIVYIMSN